MTTIIQEPQPMALAPDAAPAAPTFNPPPFAHLFVKPEEVGLPKSVLLYGAPGTWKTSIAGGIAEVERFANARILFIDIDQGSTVLVNNPVAKKAIEDGRLDILPIDKLAPNAFSVLGGLLGQVDANGNFQQGAAFGYGYDVVILDSLDVAQDVAADYFLRTTISEKTGKPDTLRAWGIIGKWTNDVAWALQNASALGIEVCHSRESAEDSGQLKIRPKLSGSSKDNLASIPDLVVYLDFEDVTNEQGEVETKLVATLGQDHIIQAKNRWGLPAKIVDFTLPKLYAHLEGTGKAAPKTVARKPRATKAKENNQ